MSQNLTDEEARDFIRGVLKTPNRLRVEIVTIGDFTHLVEMAKKIIIEHGAHRVFEFDYLVPEELFVRKQHFVTLETSGIEIKIKTKNTIELIQVILSTGAIALTQALDFNLDGELPDWIFELPHKIFLIVNSILPMDSKSGVIAFNKSSLAVQICSGLGERFRGEEEIKSHSLCSEEINGIEKFLTYMERKHR